MSARSHGHRCGSLTIPSQAALALFLLIGLALAGCGRKPPPEQNGAPPAAEEKPQPLDRPDGPRAEAGNRPPVGGEKSEPPSPPPPRPSKLRPVVYLAPADPPELGGGRANNLLLRELVRQAFLLAARESLGLATRDATLREAAPDDLPAENRLHLTTAFVMNHAARFTVERRVGADRKTLLVKEGELFRSRPEDVLQVLQTAEALSRTDFVNALAGAGFAGKPNVARRDAAVPRPAEDLLGEMTFPAQFQAVRDLHAALRSQGESPVRVGALVRAYAHLGVLTECQWSPANKAYRARSLLYAQRLVAADPQSPWGYWHRAYAAGLAGMHRLAHDDLARAAQLAQQSGRAGPESQAPAWVTIIDAVTKFDAARLKEAARNPRHAQLALLLHFLAVESKTSIHRTLEAARLALRDNPECFRIHDSIADLGGVSTRHVTTVAGMELFAKTFPQRLAALPGLPDSVARLLRTEAAERDVLAALVATGQSAGDASEPSWALLGRWAQDARFLQVCRRLYFMDRMWNVPVDDFLAEARALVGDHPLAAFVESYGVNRARDRDGYARLLTGLSLTDLDYRADSLYRAIAAADPKHYQDKRLGATARELGDYCHFDFVQMIAMTPPGATRARMARALLGFSPYSPTARATLIADDWEWAKQHAAAWEKGPAHPDVLLALGQRYAALKQAEDAERCLKKCIALSPDRAPTRALAEVYQAAGKTDQWLATLEEFLQGEDTGLDHAEVRVELARHFMRQKDFKRALPYAEAAAETWAEWAMRCAGACHEGLGNWDKAELWIRRVSERYETGRAAWFFWCKRTGRGDLRSAQALLEQGLQQLGPQRSADDLLRLGAYHCLTGQPRKAIEPFRELLRDERTAWSYPLLALLLDELGDRAERDKLLKAVPANNPYKPLTDLLSAHLAKGEKVVPDAAAAEAVRKGLPPSSWPIACYLIGRFLELHGQAQAGREYLQRCLAETEAPDTLFPALAGARLNAARPR